MGLLIKSDFGFSTTFEIASELQKAIEQTLENINKLVENDATMPHCFNVELVGLSISSRVENPSYKSERVGYVVKFTLSVKKDGKYVKVSEDICEEMFSLIGTIKMGQREEPYEPIYENRGLACLFQDMSAYARHVYKEEALVYAQRHLKDFC